MNSDDARQRRGPMPDLHNLLIDRNRDGFPDDIVGMLSVPEDLDRTTWEAVLNLSARLGLASSGFSPPIVAREPLLGRVSVTVRAGDADRLNALAMDEQQPGPAPDQPSTDEPGRIDLRDPWSIAGFMLDRDDDQAADDSAIHILLPDEVPYEIGVALAELAARTGVECGSLTLPIAGGTAPTWRRAFRIAITGDDSATLTRDPSGDLRMTGNAGSIATGIRLLAGLSPGFLPDRPVHRATEWLRRSAAGWTDTGRAAQFRSVLNHQSPDRIVIPDAEPALRQHLESIVAQTRAGIAVDPESPGENVVFDHQWSAEWEVARLLRALEEEILPSLDPAEPIDLITMISEPPSVRRRIRGQISRLMLQRGFREGSLHVLDAFKPGLSWLQEVILPELRASQEIGQITVQARAWPPENHAGQLDMPIRWLQELFPGDEILATELGLSLDQVTISLDEGLEPIYRVSASASDGEQVLDRSFSPLWRRIDYLAGFGDAGNVTVTTGGIIARQSGAMHRARVLTDQELFWRYWQGELLPALRRFILTSTDQEPESHHQPLFDDLFVHVRMSASDHPYNIRQERHSAAEALHEDIYFNALDFVEELGQRTSGDKLSAPGSVRPFVSVTEGRQPEARIRLTRRPAGIAMVIFNGEARTIQPATRTLPPTPDVSGITFNGDRITVHIEQSPALDAIQPFLGALAIESPSGTTSLDLSIATADGVIEIGAPDASFQNVPQTVADGEIPDDTIISNQELFPHLNRLAGHPSVTLAPAAEISWQGRPIPAVAVTSPQEAAIWSMRKLSHFKPTKLIVARHHANEVASTTSALQMIEALTGDSSGDSMLRGLNAVFLPLENPDGAALHDALRQDNPRWKHHPARYNATGYEFGEDQGNPDSQYGEGRIRDLVWHACLPDIVVDNHGVPSHEWAQLFAGFGSPPRFGVSYWQVQALLYGILPYLDEPVHRATRDAVRDRVASEIAADADLLRWNRIYTERYRTWGHQWLPDRFPMELFQEMLFHSNPVDPDSVRGRRSYAVRYPNTTILNWVTEVCDETVEGEELRRTARAHFLANKAVMELLREQAVPSFAVAEPAPGGVRIRTGRERPLRVAGE